MNYKEMYLDLFRATEKAINILIEAQRECEEKYISEDNIVEFIPKETE